MPWLKKYVEQKSHNNFRKLTYVEQEQAAFSYQMAFPCQVICWGDSTEAKGSSNKHWISANVGGAHIHAACMGIQMIVGMYLQVCT